MSCNDMRTLCGRTGLKNRLDARQEPIMGINPGRNAPLNLTNDSASRKRFVDFCDFLQTVLIAEACRRGVHTIALILDNGSTHAPKRLVPWLEEQSLSCNRKVMFQVYWLPTNASWLDQIEIWF